MKSTILIIAVFFFQNTKVFTQSTFEVSSSVKAANAILSTLSKEQKSIVNLSFQDTSRVKWSNLPKESISRKGIQMKELVDSQRIALHLLLRSVLSEQGYQKFLFIIQYDEATHERLGKANNPIADRYGNQNYWFSIFGTPAIGSTWGWKFEGHHISLNLTYSTKGVSCTPMFVGINPALTTTGPYAGFHVMSEENEYGNQLFASFSNEMKQKAIISPLQKDADVMTQIGNEPHIKDKKGVGYVTMNKQQKALVEKIIFAWVGNLNPALAKEKMAKIMKNKKNLIFTWQGTTNVNELHYYSIKTENFIIEYSNRDGGIYHYHTIWRDLEEDFGN
jgi:Protein of unknown function (DUF3500)